MCHQGSNRHHSLETSETLFSFKTFLSIPAKQTAGENGGLLPTCDTDEPSPITHQLDGALGFGRKDFVVPAWK